MVALFLAAISRYFHPDASVLWAAAVDRTEPTDPIMAQYGPAAVIVVPLISALVWYVKRSEARWEAALKRESDRADRYEERFNAQQLQMAALLDVGARTQGEVIAIARDLQRRLP